MSKYIQTIALNNVKCFARHGWYPEEHLTGCWFIVDVVTTFPVQGTSTEDLTNTVNYEVLNTIILDEMADTRKLLETVVRGILNKVTAQYSFLLTAEVTIRKLNPPMQGEIGNSLVRLTYTA